MLKLPVPFWFMASEPYVWEREPCVPHTLWERVGEKQLGPVEMQAGKERVPWNREEWDQNSDCCPHFSLLDRKINTTWSHHSPSVSHEVTRLWKEQLIPSQWEVKNSTEPITVANAFCPTVNHGNPYLCLKPLLDGFTSSWTVVKSTPNR